MSDLRKKSVKNSVGIKRVKKEEFVLTISKDDFEKYVKRAIAGLTIAVGTIVITNGINDEIIFGKYHYGAIGTYYNNETVYAVNNGKAHAYHERELNETFLKQFKTSIKTKDDLDFEVYNFYYEIQDNAPARTGQALKSAALNIENIKQDLRDNNVNEYEISKIEEALSGFDSIESPLLEYISKCDCKDFKEFTDYVKKKTVNRIKEGDLGKYYVEGNDANENVKIR